MKRNIADRSTARSLLIAVTLGLGVLTAVFQPGRALASFSNADRQEQPAAVVAPPAEPAAARPVAPSAAARAAAASRAAAQQRRMASKQRAMQVQSARQAEMARRQGEEQHRARRRAFVGGVIVGILAARRR